MLPCGAVGAGPGSRGSPPTGRLPAPPPFAHPVRTGPARRRPRPAEVTWAWPTLHAEQVSRLPFVWGGDWVGLGHQTAQPRPCRDRTSLGECLSPVFAVGQLSRRRGLLGRTSAGQAEVTLHADGKQTSLARGPRRRPGRGSLVLSSVTGKGTPKCSRENLWKTPFGNPESAPRPHWRAQAFRDDRGARANRNIVSRIKPLKLKFGNARVKGMRKTTSESAGGAAARGSHPLSCLDVSARRDTCVSGAPGRAGCGPAGHAAVATSQRSRSLRHHVIPRSVEAVS